MKKIILFLITLLFSNNSYSFQYDQVVISNKSINIIEIKRETIFGIFTGTMLMLDGYYVKPVLLPENHISTVYFCRNILRIEPNKFYSILKDNILKIKSEIPIIMPSEDTVELYIYSNPYTIGYVSENKLFFIGRDGLLRIINVID